LKELGELTYNLSGRDIHEICKDAERKWASKYIRKEVSTLEPEVSIYKEATQVRQKQTKDANLRMEGEYTPY